ncbi:MAG: GAF domain-containing sensor histidine kinase [Bacteroidia bacterium]|nr:GAF domain-containing sensor histidine kinase [Bacteroidia bacterium]
MISAALPANERERLEELRRYEILDTGSEKDLEEIVQLASTICQTPISLVSLIDENRQWFKARTGLDVPETGRDVAFCSHVLLEKDVMVVENALEDVRFADNPLVTSDPNIRFYAGAPLVTPGGFKLGTLCIIDKQPRKLNEQQLFALKTLSKQVIQHFELSLQNKKLNKLNEFQNRMLSILSHDMRNPLVGIDGLLTMMTEGDISREDFQNIMADASGQVKMVLTLLNDMMDWAKGAGSTRLNKTTFLLNDTAQKCLSVVKPMAENKNLTLINHIPDDLSIHADEPMVQFILRNLLTNAVKFTAKGSIELSAVSKPGSWEITVTDTGTGMTPEQISKLLNAENRYTTEGTEKEKGSGLGLLLSNEFIGKHGGELTIKSNPGQGSAFSFTLMK